MAETRRPTPSGPLESIRIRATDGAERSAFTAERKVDKTVVKPLDLQRLSGIGGHFAADIFAGPVVNLNIGLLDDAEHHD